MNTTKSSVLSTDTLSPLPPVLQRGLVAVAFCGLLSLLTTGSLFAYLTFRFGCWYWKGQLSQGANQFVVLIYNLLFADIQQALAFSITTSYLASNGIKVGTTTCWVNGTLAPFGSTVELGSGNDNG